MIGPGEINWNLTLAQQTRVATNWAPVAWSQLRWLFAIAIAVVVAIAIGGAGASASAFAWLRQVGSQPVGSFARGAKITRLASSAS